MYNFEDTEKTGVVAAKGARINGLPATVTVPAWGKVEIAGVYRPSEAESLDRLVLRGRFNGRKSSRLVINSGGAMRQIGYPAPLGTWERRTIDLSGEKNLSEVGALSIGLNPAGHDLTYWIRNVRLYKSLSR